MKQYERIVSYLYRYEGEKKQENSGYAKIESRETECRIQIQTRLAAPIKGARAYFYHQNQDGIETVDIGEMQVSRSEMHCKTKTLADNLFGSGKKFEDVDGIVIYFGTTVCYATTWKNDYFYLGKWKPDREETTSVSDQERNTGEKNISEGENSISSAPYIPETAENKAQSEDKQLQEDFSETDEQKQEASCETVEMAQEDQEEVWQKIPIVPEGDSFEEDEVKIAEMLPEEVNGVMEKSDFSYRILKTFPTMYPFQDTEKGNCVKMDLQDIGCLPMRFWSLSGNRFLLHAYYCYRHLIFLKQNGRYYMGVPGIYNEKEKRSGLKYGFKLFRPVSDEKRQGAFGYWLLELN